MKPHIIIKLRAESAAPDVPYWQAILTEKDARTETFLPAVDRIVKTYNLPVWATREYQASDRSWSDEEQQSGLNRIYRLILRRSGTIPQSMIDRIALLPQVERIHVGTVAAIPLPRPRAQSLSSRTDLESRKKIYLPQAHRICTGDKHVTIAVLDTGIDINHPELSHRMLPGKDFDNILDGAGQFLGDFLDADHDPDDDVGHGTHVAGIIGAAGRAMPRGVAPQCSILPVRVLAALKKGDGVVGAGLIENIDAGVKYAVDRGADVINMRLGVQHRDGGLPHHEVIDYAVRKGVTIVAASGNDGTDQLYYPGAFDQVIAVGACDVYGEVAAFSTYGSQVSFVAPGTNIYSSHIDGGYAFSSGTSHAAPFVAGAVGLLKSYAKTFN
ncbi:MAG: S8 family peptidase, partial [Chitinivibrionales bacterium]